MYMRALTQFVSRLKCGGAKEGNNSTFFLPHSNVVVNICDEFILSSNTVDVRDGVIMCKCDIWI